MEQLTNHPRIEMVARTSLTPNPDNPRRHGAKQMEQLTQSLRRFGFKGALIVDDRNMIITGNALWDAAGACGMDEVPVIRVDFLSEAERRAFALAHNRLAELSDWDEALLAKELEFLFEQEYDFSGTGFDLGDLDFSVAAEPVKEPPVELPAPDAVAISRPDDLWLIGPHRLYCGNARDAASYEAVLGDERAAMIFCDPPYNVSITRHASGLGKADHPEFAEASGEMTQSEFTAFLRAIFRNCARFSADGSIHYHCMDWRHTREMLDAADGVYSDFKQLVVWAKNNAGMGTFYRSQHELIFVFKSGPGKHINNFGLGEGGRYRTNVWSYDGANTFRKGRDQDLAAHPTVKNVAMVADAILDCSNRNDLILDPCGGSCTTIDAAHRARRRGAAIEIDPLCITALVQGRRVYIIDVWRRRVEFPDLRKAAIALAGDHRTDLILIEDQASGTQLLQTLRNDVIPGVPTPIARRPEADKQTRLSGVSAMIEAGDLFLPREAVWLAEFRQELLAFPSARYDDQVDALSQLLAWVRQQSADLQPIGGSMLVRGSRD